MSSILLPTTFSVPCHFNHTFTQKTENEYDDDDFIPRMFCQMNDPILTFPLPGSSSSIQDYTWNSITNFSFTPSTPFLNNVSNQTRPQIESGMASADLYYDLDLEPTPITEMIMSQFQPQQLQLPLVSPNPSIQPEIFHQSVCPSFSSNFSSHLKRDFAELEASSWGENQCEEPPKKFNRRERNREHAKRSRLRKKDVTATLEQSLMDLKDENEKLRALIYEKLGNKAKPMIAERTVTPTDQFISALKQKENQVMNEEQLEVLRSLRKNISSLYEGGITTIG